MPVKIRVAIADDHAILRQGLAQLLRNTEGIELVAEADDGTSLMDAIREFRPDVAVSDVSMATFGAERVAELVLAEGLQTRVVALTVHEEANIAGPILQAGVSGYVLKKNAFEELLEAIQTVYAGGNFVSATVAGTLLASPVANGQSAEELSARELEVLRGIARGWPYKRVAREMDISVRTVETYRERMLKKLALATTADLIRYAIDRGYLASDD